MELVLETHRKPAPGQTSEEVGRAKMIIEESVFRILENLEQDLADSDRREIFSDIDPETLHLQMPDDCDEICDCKIRMYMDDAAESGQFHIVGRGAHDNSLIYTDAVMVRMVAV